MVRIHINGESMISKSISCMVTGPIDTLDIPLFFMSLYVNFASIIFVPKDFELKLMFPHKYNDLSLEQRIDDKLIFPSTPSVDVISFCHNKTPDELNLATIHVNL